MSVSNDPELVEGRPLTAAGTIISGLLILATTLAFVHDPYPRNIILACVGFGFAIMLLKALRRRAG